MLEILNNGNAFGFRYTNEYRTIKSREYIYHRFTFDRSDIQRIASSYRDAQGYANGMIDSIWNLEKGRGADLGKFVGRVWLGDRLYRMAKDAKQNNWDSMGVEIRSRADKEGKWALEFLDKVADTWKELTDMD